MEKYPNRPPGISIDLSAFRVPMPLWLPNGKVVYIKPTGEPVYPNPIWLPKPKKPLFYPNWMPPPPPEEDDSWLDEEIAKEDDEIMKTIMIEAKQYQAKREYIAQERKHIVQRRQYADDINATEGFDVGVYPHLAGKFFCGPFITRYYYPPEITVKDYQMAYLTRLANLAIDQYNNKQGTEFGNVLVIKAMSSFSNGFWYYLTFQASFGLHNPPEIFETKVHEDPRQNPPPTAPFFEFVRCKIVKPKITGEFYNPRLCDLMDYGRANLIKLLILLTSLGLILGYWFTISYLRLL